MNYVNMNPTELVYLIGKNAVENWELYKKSQKTDTIFHLDKFSSAYVIINVEINKLTIEQINTAANLCKSHSKYKNVPHIGVFYTSISNTKLGKEIGSFIIISNRKTKTIKV